MRTYKCDRCGRFFEKKNECQKTSFYIMTFNPHCLDLCPDCNAKLQEWVSNSKEEIEHKCHNCAHYLQGEYDGSCGSYICKDYSAWEQGEETK